jgi:hypothetical protein
MTAAYRGLRLTSAILLATAALSACSAEDDQDFTELSIEEIEKEVRTDMGDLKSLSFTASMTAAGATTELSLRADRDGSCVGTASAAGVSAELIRTSDGSNFMKGDQKLWRTLGGSEARKLARLVGSRWAKFGAEDRFSAFCDLDDLLSELNRDDAKESTARKGEASSVDGREVIEIVSENGASTTTAKILVSDPHYVVELTSEGEATGHFEFSGFDEPVAAEAPDDYVDLG